MKKMILCLFLLFAHWYAPIFAMQQTMDQKKKEIQDNQRKSDLERDITEGMAHLDSTEKIAKLERWFTQARTFCENMGSHFKQDPWYTFFSPYLDMFDPKDDRFVFIVSKLAELFPRFSQATKDSFIKYFAQEPKSRFWDKDGRVKVVIINKLLGAVGKVDDNRQALKESLEARRNGVAGEGTPSSQTSSLGTPARARAGSESKLNHDQNSQSQASATGAAPATVPDPRTQRFMSESSLPKLKAAAAAAIVSQSSSQLAPANTDDQKVQASTLATAASSISSNSSSSNNSGSAVVRSLEASQVLRLQADLEVKTKVLEGVQQTMRAMEVNAKKLADENARMAITNGEHEQAMKATLRQNLKLAEERNVLEADCARLGQEVAAAQTRLSQEKEKFEAALKDREQQLKLMQETKTKAQEELKKKEEEGAAKLEKYRRKSKRRKQELEEARKKAQEESRRLADEAVQGVKLEQQLKESYANALAQQEALRKALQEKDNEVNAIQAAATSREGTLLTEEKKRWDAERAKLERDLGAALEAKRKAERESAQERLQKSDTESKLASRLKEFEEEKVRSAQNVVELQKQLAVQQEEKRLAQADVQVLQGRLEATLKEVQNTQAAALIESQEDQLEAKRAKSENELIKEELALLKRVRFVELMNDRVAKDNWIQTLDDYEKEIALEVDDKSSILKVEGERNAIQELLNQGLAAYKNGDLVKSYDLFKKAAANEHVVVRVKKAGAQDSCINMRCFERTLIGFIFTLSLHEQKELGYC